MYLKFNLEVELVEYGVFVVVEGVGKSFRQDFYGSDINNRVDGGINFEVGKLEEKQSGAKL